MMKTNNDILLTLLNLINFCFVAWFMLRRLEEIPICRDSLAIIVNSQCSVKDIAEDQLRRIFSKEITNWSEVGGPNQPIVVFVPGKNTAAYKNFDHEAMKRNRIRYDFMSYESTTVIKAIERFPWEISVIGQGSARNTGDVKKYKD